MLAIPVKDKSENPEVDDRFGRASYFCILDNSKIIKFIENSSTDASSGAGTGSVKLLSDEDVDMIVAPHVGPKAMDVIKMLEMTVFDKGDCKTITEVLESLKLNKLEKVYPSAKSGLRRV